MQVGHIADVDVVALEVLFKDDDVAFGESGVDEMIHQQIETHPRRHAEDRRQPQGDDVFALQEMLFRLNFRSAVQRDRLERAILGAETVAAGDAVAAVGVGIDHQLVAAAQAVEQPDRFQVDRRGQCRIAVARAGADDGGQVNNHVRPLSAAFITGSSRTSPLMNSNAGRAHR